jgi:peptidoglycan/LPS O-acetylase OafA/YrhL
MTSQHTYRTVDLNGTIYKIYPAFYCFLAFSITINYAKAHKLSYLEILGEVFFLQNYLGGVWNHTWSLAVEEHFYIGLAALFAFWAWIKPKHNYSAIPLAFLTVSSVCFALRLATLYAVPEFSYAAYLFGTHIRIDSLFFGVLLSYLVYFHKLEQKLSFIPTWLFFVVGGLLLTPAFVFPLETNKFISTIGVIPFYIGSGSILIGALRVPESSSLPLKMLGAFGAGSYSVYLWHMPVNVWGWPLVKRLTGLDGFVPYCFVYIAGSFLFGLLMSRVVEFPVLRLRELHYPSGLLRDSNQRQESTSSSAETSDGAL